MSCSICTENFNKSNHSKVTCPACVIVVCSECVERYLCMITENPHCMSCRAAWNRDMLETCGLSKKFVRITFKKRREDVLFERERGMMPATQPFVEKAMTIKRLNEQIGLIDHQCIQAQHKYGQDLLIPLQVIADEIGSESMIECMMVRLQRAYENYKPTHMLLNTKNLYTAQIAALNFTTIDVKKEARKFVRACTQNDCAGFLSTAWKCGVCDKRTCPDCHNPKEDDHVCDLNSLETARLLARDTKTCPKCAALIFKIEGCDQMWCTQCSTAFSWRTGQIEVGRIHNPHYYEYQRNAGRIQREIGDIPCGGMPDVTQLRNVVRRNREFYGNIIRWHHHIALVMMPNYVPRWTDNQDLRIRYMMKEMSADVFKQKIQAREKDNEKRLAIANVLNTYQIVSAEIMQRIVASKDEDEISQEFHQIREYVNDLMSKITHRYQCVTPRITPEYAVIVLK